MHLFGDPSLPRKNIIGGSLVMVVAAFEFGTFTERAIMSGGVRVDYFLLVMFVGLFFIGIKTFRVGLAFLPPDAGDRGADQRGPRSPAVWIGLILFWIVLIVVPVAIIQYFARR